ncbi:alpha-1,2-fucosyltransferase [Bacillus sp. OTU530]|uniref:alpha-1,2-fucosyltransferase n=1 Tax=Bacillus sp. OTU530 TaxID=3043862 RepID=UPI00313ADB0D
MIIIKYCGGLGNQMYQYALQSVLQEVYPEQDFKADIFHYNLLKEHNGFELCNEFEISLKVADKDEIKKVSCGFVPGNSYQMLPYKLRYFIAHKQNYIRQINGLFRKKVKQCRISGYGHNVYNDVVFHLNKERHYYLDGLWQNINYFKDYESLVKRSFKFKRKLLGDDQILGKHINDLESVSVHVRRGDFANSKFDICGKTYYKAAFDAINKLYDNPHFFFFSDDVEFVREHFSDIDNKTIVTHSKADGVLDMQLMSMCKCNIIANSTFSFWSAFLNNNEKKVVIAPAFSLKDEIGCYEFSLPADWIRINPFNGELVKNCY